MPSRTFTGANGYRFGFNGKEKDDEVKGSGNALEFGGRSIYDSRLARFVSVDPRWRDFSFMSPYCFAGNNPILFVDQDGEGPGFGILLGGPALNMGMTKLYNATVVSLYNWAVESHQRGMGYVNIASKVHEQNKSNGVDDGITLKTKALVYAGSYLYGGANQVLPGFSNIEDAKNARSNFQQGNYKTAMLFAFFAIPELGNAGKYINSATGRLFRLGENSKFVLKGIDKFGECEAFAADFMKKIAPSLEEAGATVKHFRIEDAGIVSMGTTKVPISQTGIHEFMEVTKKDGQTFVVDNMHPDGMLKSDYMQDIAGLGKNGKEISGKELLNKAVEVK